MMEKMCSLILFVFKYDFSQEMAKDKFETYHYTCNFSDNIFPLRYNRHIKSGLKYFLVGSGGGGSPPSNYTGSISSITSQSAGNNHNDEVSADTSDTETCLSLERERNKAKLDRWSYQQIPVLRTK